MRNQRGLLMTRVVATPHGFHHGDALQVLRRLPDDIVHVGVTSPPYNKQEKHKGWLVDKVMYDAHTDAAPEGEYQAGQVEVLDEVFRVTRPGGSFFYNHKVRWVKGEMLHPLDWLRETRWTIRQEIIWDRAIAANIRGWRFWQVEERIYWLIKPRDGNRIGRELRSADAKLTSIWRGVPDGKNPHPAPFPLWLPARAIVATAPAEGGVVLDPYVGSGTTAVAARLLGCRFIGIDVSREYLETAKARLENAESERPALDKELALHRIETTFAERKREKMFVGKHRGNSDDTPDDTAANTAAAKHQAAALALDL